MISENAPLPVRELMGVLQNLDSPENRKSAPLTPRETWVVAQALYIVMTTQGLRDNQPFLKDLDQIRNRLLDSLAVRNSWIGSKVQESLQALGTDPRLMIQHGDKVGGVSMIAMILCFTLWLHTMEQADEKSGELTFDDVFTSWMNAGMEALTMADPAERLEVVQYIYRACDKAFATYSGLIAVDPTLPQTLV